MKDILNALSVLVGMLAISMCMGCAAFSTAIGHSEPDPTKIQAGDTRNQVEHILGYRLWRPGSADGLTCDIYEHEVEKPAHPIVGAVVLFFDVFMAGAPEILLHDAQRFADVKQVAVVYDEQDHVQFVSKPWPVDGTVSQCRRMRSVLPKNSGVPPAARPSPTDRPGGAASEVAVLELECGSCATIDGHKAEGPVVELSPGRHTVTYQTTLGVSITMGEFEHSYHFSADVELLPGRLYRLKHERFYGWPSKYADLFWIEDVNSGETLYCVWPGGRTNCERIQYAGGETLRCD